MTLVVLATGASLRNASAVPPGFIYTEGASMMLDGSPITLFGVNEGMGFIFTDWAMTGEPQYWGRNFNFPNFDGTIPDVASADEFWNAYFRYFLHYQETAESYGHPYPNLLRVGVGWDHGYEGSYDAWKNTPAIYYENFDAMVRWAKAAGVYLVPMLMINEMVSGDDNYYMWQYFDTSSTRYAHLVEFERGLMSKYATEPTIAIWDVFNEADMARTSVIPWVNWWTTHGGFTAFKAWEQGLVNDVRSATSQLLTVGHGMTSADSNFPNEGFAYDQTWYNAFSDIQGMDVSHVHVYDTVEDQDSVDAWADWTRALGKPMFIGELGYGGGNAGYWPWRTAAWLAKGVGPVASLTWRDTGKGPYADYPYLGSLPPYPSEGPIVQSVTSTSFPTDSTSHLVQMPATAQAGDLLIVFFASDGTPNVTSPTGWTFFFGWNSWEGSGNKFSMYAKKAVGTEGGTTVNFVTTTAEKAAAQVYRITGWRDSGVLSNDIEWFPNAGATSANPDPPLRDPINWDVENTLWIAAYGADDDFDVTAYPAGYTIGMYTESDASTTSTSMSSAYRILSAASEDPGTFTITGSVFWIASTVAVRPAA